MRVRAAFPKLLIALTAASLLLAGCSTAGSDTENAASDGCITDFDPSVDYFPDKSEIVDAEKVATEKLTEILEKTPESELARFDAITAPDFQAPTFRGDRIAVFKGK